jgi:glycosyltransferase involved in cell wall biosynthesis
MKILYVSDAQSIHTRRWAEYFRDRGADVHIASFRPCDIRGVKIHILPTFGLGKLGYFFALFTLRTLYTRLRPDVVHAQYVTSYGFLAALAGLQPLIVTAWGTDVLISPKESRLMRFFARYAVRHAAAITTVAEHMNASVVDLDVPSTRVTAIPFGVDTQFFVPSPHSASVNMPLRLICTRNFGQIYDVQTLIRALALVFARGYRLNVDLVGEGPLRQSLVDLVNALGLEQQVHFHGHVDHPTLAGLLAAADIFVSPALSDGNNVSLNEAMACGCFPVATAIPANAQWIQDGKNGYLYPPGDVGRLAAAIEMAIKNASLRSAARDENRKIVETWADWHVCVKRMESIYERLSRKRFDET